MAEETNGYNEHPSKRKKLTAGQRAADTITKWAGSWTFIFLFLVFMCIWMWLNVSAFFFARWDPYPFILLNLALSCLAAIQAPVILMSQNRTNERDRMRAEYDYKINRKAEREIKNVQQELAKIKRMVSEVSHTIERKPQAGRKA